MTVICLDNKAAILYRGGGRSARQIRPFEKNLKTTIICPVRTLKMHGFDGNEKIFGPTKVGVVGLALPALSYSFLNLIESLLLLIVRRFRL